MPFFRRYSLKTPAARNSAVEVCLWLWKCLFFARLEFKLLPLIKSSSWNMSHFDIAFLVENVLSPRKYLVDRAVVVMLCVVALWFATDRLLRLSVVAGRYCPDLEGEEESEAQRTHTRGLLLFISARCEIRLGGCEDSISCTSAVYLYRFSL